MNTVSVDNGLLSVAERQQPTIYWGLYASTQLPARWPDWVPYFLLCFPVFNLNCRCRCRLLICLQINNILVTAYPIPEDASAQGCHSPVGCTLRIPDAWQSGYYVAKMRVADSGGRFTHQSHRIAEGFFVRCHSTGTTRMWHQNPDPTSH